MSEYPDVDAGLAEVQAKAARVQANLKKIRGTGTAANGTIVATVDSAGHLRGLTLPPNTTRFGSQLSLLILEATAAAEKDAARKSAHAVRPLTADDRVQAGLTAIRATLNQHDRVTQQPRALTEDEIQAADDAYFEKMNGNGWLQR
ncbi:YbaB/EbfC family nucleoid-associated protein [Nocardia wallacei]|uniref:YbaB/EbfC DNA-binding family protein n=1 Tax=Nocardia wallacei TaxID=480035 RepID=A0A7G1KLT5_9NOCA|nr:YbaB/EbfC family nucleoid-associated protein [Nocardia wallacei]BCK56217.1 hypothetical protein NWFMUON74_39890 [Nocardia wallacei]